MSGARGGIRTLDLSITRRMIDVDLDGFRRTNASARSSGTAAIPAAQCRPVAVGDRRHHRRGSADKSIAVHNRRPTGPGDAQAAGHANRCNSASSLRRP